MTKIPKKNPVAAPDPSNDQLEPLSRDEAATLVANRSDMLLRRLRGRLNALRAAGLGGPNAASLLDEDDVLASITRRLDAAVANGTFRSRNDSDLWAYVQGITQRVIQQRLRTGARDLRLFAAISGTERKGIAAMAETELDRLAPLLRDALTDPEWEMLVLRSRGFDGRGLAAAGTSEVTVRKRWSRVLAVVRKALIVTVVSPPPRSEPLLTCGHWLAA